MKYVISVSKAYKHRGKHRHKASTKKFWFVYFYEFDEIDEEWHLQTKQIKAFLVPFYKAKKLYKRTFYCLACNTKFWALVKKRQKEIECPFCLQ